MKKVLIINGSPNKNGCTKRAILEIRNEFQKHNVECSIYDIGHLNIRGCIACNKCKETGKCIFDDIVNEISSIAHEFDGLIIGSPVYFASANGTLISFLDRLFYMSKSKFEFKPAACITSARRAGTLSAFDQLNKYFLISNMFVVGNNYWNNVHGYSAQDVERDLEGLQTMRQLARNMSYLINCLDGKQKPSKEEKILTNFIK